MTEDLSCVPHNKSGSPKLSVPQLNIQASNDEENERYCMAMSYRTIMIGALVQ